MSEIQSASHSNSGVDKTLFLHAMSILPGPVSLVTTGEGENRMGLTVSALCSLSAEPPSLIVCVNKNASAHDELLSRGTFGVNVLKPDQADFATLFTQRGVDRFASSEWIQRVTGAPLLGSALIAFDCRLERSIDGFSHTILIGSIADIVVTPEAPSECLVWHQRRYRTCAEIA